MTQFLRKTWAIIGVPGQDGLRIDGLRIAFDVGKKDGQAINTAKITIYNVSETTARASREDGATIQLYAGYGEDAGLIYLGEIRTSERRRERPEIMLVLECGDGQKARGTTINKTIRGQSKVGAVLATLAKAAGLSLDISPADAARQLPAPRGMVLNGPTLQQVNRSTKMARLDWTIEDGAIVIVKRGEASRMPALLITQESGMIGSPTPMQKGKLKLKMYLNPGARLRRIVRVISQEFDGWFMIRSLRHFGDSGYAGDYFTEIECTEIRPRGSS